MNGNDTARRRGAGARDGLRSALAGKWLLWLLIAAVGASTVIWLQRLGPDGTPQARMHTGPKSEAHGIVYREFSPSGALRHRIEAASGQLFGRGVDAYATLREATLTHWPDGGAAFEFSASTLTVWPEGERASSDGPVSVRGPAVAFRAVGMELSLMERRITLLSQVHGAHALR